MLKRSLFVLAAGVGIVATGGAVAADDIATAAWLQGCWAVTGAEAGSVEQWTAPAGGTMLGMSRTVRGGKTVEYEFLQIRAQKDGKLAYMAMPSGQPAAAFPLLRYSQNELVFENPAHDFPQRIIYRRTSASTLAARIEGGDKGRDFPMTRISCDAPAVQATARG